MTSKEERLVVSLLGGGPWGFRLQGGAGTGLPLIVSKVRRKSKAYRRLREGDRILSVNGRTCQGLTYDQLMDIADRSGTDLTLEILRRECDKENQVPRQESVKTINQMDNTPAVKEIVSFTETSTKVTEEKEGLRIKSATVMPESKAFESFISPKLESRPPEKAPEKVVESFPSFRDLQPLTDSCTSSKQESRTGDDKNFTKTVVEKKHEVKGGTETSFIKREHESFSKSTNDTHNMPDITMDTIDLNNLISETQKRLDSFKNNFKNSTETGQLDSFQNSFKHNTEAGTQQQRLEAQRLEAQRLEAQRLEAQRLEAQRLEAAQQLEAVQRLDSFKNRTESSHLDSFKKSTEAGQLDSFKMDGILNSSSFLNEIKKTETLSSSLITESKTFETSNMSEMSSKKVSSESTGLEQSTESVVPKLTDPVKKIPPPTLPKPKTQSNPCLDVFKDCLKEMETDPIFSLPDLGFTSQSSESSTTTTDIPFGTITEIKKKKMFSSSSFYEEPESIYPTLEEQVEMARKIADSLADDTNKKSKGANMFYKRVKRSSKWIHEGPEPSDESAPGTPEIQGMEPPTPDPSFIPFRPSKGPANLKLILSPRHPQDLAALRSSGFVISEHNVVSPEVCHGLVKDLHSPVGKGAALFAKRKKKSEEWVVDEEKVKALVREQEHRRFTAPPLSTSPMNQYQSLTRQDVKLVKTPWEAAMESPYGFCDSAFARVNPDHLADTVIRAADNKRAGSLSRESSRMEGCISPPPAPPPLTPAGAIYDIYHAKPPKGWSGSTATIDYSSSMSAAAPPPPVSSVVPQSSSTQNGFQTPKKMVFQNFNTVPRLWRGASVH